VATSPSDDDPAMTPSAEADEAVFIEQARWLLEYHDRRSESVSTRAVALLGFAGVILALAPQARLPEGVELTFCIAAAFVVALAGVFLGATACIRVLTTRELKAPAVGQLRANWKRWADAPASYTRGQVAADVAEGLLLGRHLDKESPIDSAIDAADKRASAFKWAVRALAVTLAAMVFLFIQVGIQLSR